jgi:hypothetical protein
MLPPDCPRHAPLALWRIAQYFVHAFFNLFGAPEAIAAQSHLYDDDRELMLSWLRTGEALLRHLLFIEASALDLQSCGPPASSRHRQRKRKRIEHHADNPEAWRVSFRCPMERRRPRRHASISFKPSPAGTPALHKFHSPWPIAERAEALLRAYNNPAPYALRLARRLRAAPKRIAAILRMPPDAERYVFDIGEVREAAFASKPAFDTG